MKMAGDREQEEDLLYCHVPFCQRSTMTREVCREKFSSGAPALTPVFNTPLKRDYCPSTL